MPENPYQPPKGMEESRQSDRRGLIPVVPLTLFAVPLSALAGGATYCVIWNVTGGVLDAVLAIAAGIAVMIAMLVAANRWLQSHSDERELSDAHPAIFTLAVATPIAVICGFAFGLRRYSGGDSWPYLLAAVFIPFSVWSPVFWIGLRRTARPRYRSRTTKWLRRVLGTIAIVLLVVVMYVVLVYMFVG